jgi:hypothetical protein
VANNGQNFIANRQIAGVAKPGLMRYFSVIELMRADWTVPLRIGRIVPDDLTRQGGILGGGQDFRYFLWRRLARPGALNGFVPEILASDGRRVRRMYVGDRVHTMQQYEDRLGAEAIAEMVESRAPRGAGLRGYSIFSDADALAIWHTGGRGDSAWVAFPFADMPGRAAMLAASPEYGDHVPRLRLCGGARLRWASGQLLLEAAIEQRSDGFRDEPGSPDLMDYLVGWRLETTVENAGQVKPARLAARGEPLDGIRRASGRRVESSWILNASMHQKLRGRRSLKAWFVLTFDTRLFCLPDPWRTWWFEVDFPARVDL